MAADEAAPAENVESSLRYREEVAYEAVRARERHRAKIMSGDLPFVVMHAVADGVAPLWAEALRQLPAAA